MSVAENRMALVFLLRGAGVSEKSVLEAMEVIPRDRFVDGVFKARAYEDTPLPIACGQTISAPSIVGRMTQALNVTKSHKVLEIGTGSGYQAAILGKLARRVYTVERHSELAKLAEQRLRDLQLSNVTVMKSDGGFGLQNQAPFDRILVTAAVDDPPKSLLAQLKIGGIMVVPVGRSDAVQQLIRIVKLDTGNEYEELGSVRFVPLVEGHA